MIRSAIFILAAVQLAAGDPRAPDPPIYTYSSELDRALPQPPSGFVPTIISFSFSPDEKWFAVLVGARATEIHAAGPVVGSILLLVPFHSSASHPVRVDLGVPATERPFWSPDSEVVAVQGARLTKLGVLGSAGVPKVFNLGGGELWKRPEAGAIVGFIAADRLLAYHLRGGKPAGLETVNIQTAAATPWTLNPHWKIVAIDPNRRLVAVVSDAFAEWSKTLIVDYATSKILRSLNHQTWPEYFADNGKAICLVGPANSEISSRLDIDPRTGSPPVEDPFVAEQGRINIAPTTGFPPVAEQATWPECWDVDTGKTIARLMNVQAGAPADASTRGSRMVLTEPYYLPGPGSGFRGHVVWNFRTGSEVAAWGPPAHVPLVSTVAISATGRYIAESLGAELRIYDIR